MNPTLMNALLSRMDGGRESSAQPGTVGAELRRQLLEQMVNNFGASTPSADQSTEPDGSDLLGQARSELVALKRCRQQTALLVRHIGYVFGACPHCWGTRSECVYCGGVGTAGTYPVDAEAFLRWAEPAAHQLGLQLAPIKSVTARTSRSSNASASGIEATSPNP